jgi:hypothetical protein
MGTRNFQNLNLGHPATAIIPAPPHASHHGHNFKAKYIQMTPQAMPTATKRQIPTTAWALLRGTLNM